MVILYLFLVVRLENVYLFYEVFFWFWVVCIFWLLFNNCILYWVIFLEEGVYEICKLVEFVFFLLILNLVGGKGFVR